MGDMLQVAYPRDISGLLVVVAFPHPKNKPFYPQKEPFFGLSGRILALFKHKALGYVTSRIPPSFNMKINGCFINNLLDFI